MLWPKKEMSWRLLVWFFFAVFATGGLEAQIGGGMTGSNTRWGGNNFVVGTVFWPSGKPVDRRIPLRLVSLTRSDILGSTDDQGRFIFSHVPSGTFSVVIDEEEFETVKESIDVTSQAADEKQVSASSTQQVEVVSPGGSIPQTYTMNIRLTYKVKPGSKPSIVKADDAGVRRQAVDFYNKALEFAKAGNHMAAIGQLELAVAQDPKFINAFNEMGVLHMKLNELEKADEALRAALKIKPDAFEPLINRGIVLFRSNRFADAEPVLHEALKMKASAVGRYYLGRTLIKLGRNDEAGKELQHAIDLGGEEYKEAHRLLAVIYLDHGDRKRVVEELEIYLRLAPNAPDAEELREVIRQNKIDRPESKQPSY